MITLKIPLALCLAASVVAVSCNRTEKNEAPPRAAAVSETSDPMANFPAAEEDEGIAESISPIAAAIDRNLGSATVETVTLDPEQPGWEPRVIRGWYQDRTLVRLSVTEPTDAGTMSGESVFYIDNGELRVVRRPDAIILLRPDRTIDRWMSESAEELEVSSTVKDEQSRELVAAFKRWQSALTEASPAPETLAPSATRP